MKQITSIYRAILKEVRLLGLQEPIRQDVAKYIAVQFKSHKLSDAKFCRANQAALNTARTYLTMLESSRKYQELHDIYGSRGEHTTEQAANLVGLALPKVPS